MKNLKIIAIALVSVFSFSSCSNDDPIVNEEEVITTVTTT
jgi:PBP1b-binding outer membrane lipoprotein LpoB